jgi:hypothetical protein
MNQIGPLLPTVAVLEEVDPITTRSRGGGGPCFLWVWGSSCHVRVRAQTHAKPKVTARPQRLQNREIGPLLRTLAVLELDASIGTSGKIGVANLFHHTTISRAATRHAFLRKSLKEFIFFFPLAKSRLAGPSLNRSNHLKSLVLFWPISVQNHLTKYPFGHISRRKAQ